MLSLDVVGTPRVGWQGRQLSRLSAPKVVELMALLVLHVPQGLSRTRAAELLWPEHPHAKALHLLRSLLFRIKRTASVLEEALVSEGPVLSLCPQRIAEVDLWRLETLLARPLTEGTFLALLDLYRGPFMAGHTSRWVLELRRPLSVRVKQHLKAAGETWADTLRLGLATQAFQAVFRLDPEDVQAGQALMKLYVMQGDRRAAEALAETLRKPGADPLSLPPAPLSPPGGMLTTAQADPRIHSAGSPPRPRAEVRVGREPVWQALQARWSDALAGRTSCVLIEGEAGLGKTFLLQALREQVSAQGHACAYATCQDEASIADLGVLTLLMRELPLERSPIVYRQELSRLLPWLLTPHPDLEPPFVMQDPWQPAHFFSTVTRTVLLLSPVLLLLDDLQACDEQTLTWIEFVLLDNPAERLMVVLTVDPLEQSTQALRVERLLSRLETRLGSSRFVLPRLTEPELQAVASVTLAEPPEKELLASCLHEAQGNPGDLLTMLLRRRPPGIPVSFCPAQAQLLKCISQLAPLPLPARTVGRTAAGLGPSFSLEQLRLQRLDDGELVTGLDILIRQRLVFEASPYHFAFRHHRFYQAFQSELLAP